MTANEAYARLLKARYKKSFMKCRSCLDFGSFYVFCLAPLDVSDDEDYFTGIIYEAIDKDTGRIFEYDITSDVDAYEKATPVSVTTFWNTPIFKIVNH